MFNFTFTQKRPGAAPDKFSWQAVIANGRLIGGFAPTLAACERRAAKYAPLLYFVAGPSPMDWPKYRLPQFELQQTVILR